MYTRDPLLKIFWYLISERIILQVYFLPFAFVMDESSILAHCVVVFFVTFAFIGLEAVAIEVDDPFGHDG